MCVIKALHFYVSIFRSCKFAPFYCGNALHEVLLPLNTYPNKLAIALCKDNGQKMSCECVNEHTHHMRYIQIIWYAQVGMMSLVAQLRERFEFYLRDLSNENMLGAFDDALKSRILEMPKTWPWRTCCHSKTSKIKSIVPLWYIGTQNES